MLPPTDVYTAIITNKADAPLTVVVVYKTVDGSETRRSFKVDAGASRTTEEITTESNGARFVAPIASITATLQGAEGRRGRITAPFPHVTSPTRDYPIAVSDIGLPNLVMSPLN